MHDRRRGWEQQAIGGTLSLRVRMLHVLVQRDVDALRTLVVAPSRMDNNGGPQPRPVRTTCE